MLTHVGVFAVDFSRIDTGKTVCFLVSGGLSGEIFYWPVWSEVDQLQFYILTGRRVPDQQSSIFVIILNDLHMV